MRQRSDYTFKYNKKIGRHGWLRLTPAYSIKLVKEILQPENTLFESKIISSGRILDPFCGTATTGIVAAEMGLDCTLFDINPFLVWFGNIKSTNYSPKELDTLFDDVRKIISNTKLDKEGLWVPPMRNIERWWNENTLLVLSNLRAVISQNWGEPDGVMAYNLLWIAFARLCMESSAADFNHISMSFKETTETYQEDAVKQMFLDILSSIIESARIPLNGHAEIIEGDSRILEQAKTYDMVITSPPYPNRISYIRELRPYMYWLKFLSTGAEAGEIDWKAIGGTWGSATTKLHSWEQVSPELPKELLEVCDRINASNDKNGKTMALYVQKFFDDIYIHFHNLRQHLSNGAKIYYVLGNSSFYGNYVETDIYTEEILQSLGFDNVCSKIIRKRNSKSHLYEYIIEAEWHNNKNLIN